MSLLLLFPDHSLFPAEGPAGAEAACCAPCEMPSAGTEEALRALPERWGSSGEALRGRGRLRAPAPGTAGQEPGAEGPGPAGHGTGSFTKAAPRG